MSEEMNIASWRDRFFAAFDSPGSASIAAVLPERAAPKSEIENQIMVEDSALPYFVGERKALAEEAARIMLRESARYGIIGEVRIAKAAQIPMDSLRYCLLVHQVITTTGKQVEEYYNHVNAMLMAWTRSLSEAQDKIIEDEILIGLDWDTNVSEELTLKRFFNWRRNWRRWQDCAKEM